MKKNYTVHITEAYDWYITVQATSKEKAEEAAWKQKSDENLEPDSVDVLDVDVAEEKE